MAVTAIANRKYQKQKPTKLSVGAKIHNRFDFYINDKPVAYGESEYQVGMAENIVLDQMYTRLCARSSYFVNIHFGTGTGTLSAARTSLFTHLGTKTAVDDAQSKALPTSWWRRKIVLNPEEYVGSALSEVGIAFGATSTNLVTHALIKDINGNPITLTKTALDVVTIYATVYVTFSTSNANLQLCGMPSSNPLVNYLIGGTAFPTCYFYSGRSKLTKSERSRAVNGINVTTSSALSFTSDVPNKKFYSNTYRYDINSANAHLKEFGFGSGQSTPIFSLELPASGIYAGLAIEGASVGTGDGTTSDFFLPSENIDPDSVIMYVDGVETSVTKREVCSPIKLMNISIDQEYTAGSAEFSSDGTKFVAAFGRNGVNPSDGIRVYDVLGGALYQTADPADLPPYGGYKVGISGNGLVCAVQCYPNYSAPYFKSYDYINNIWVKRADPADIPGGSSAFGRIGLSNDGAVLACPNDGTPRFKSYDWNGSAYTKRADPAVGPGGVVNECRLSADGNVLFVACDASPYLLIYDWTGSAWVKRSDPANLPAGAAKAVFVTPDLSVLAVAHSTSPYITTYDFSGGVYVKRPNPATLPAGNATSCSMNSAGTLLAVTMGSSSTTAYIYEWVSGAWVKIPDYTDLSGTNLKGCALSPAGDLLIIGCENGLPYVFVYDLTPTKLKATFATPPGLVTGEAVGTGDDSTTIFNLDHTPAADLVVKLDGVTTTDYTIVGAQITFNTAPGTSVAITADYKYSCNITADYTVNGIHKTNQRVIDLYAEITFGEVT